MGYIAVDDDTEEVLVRSFVKWDGGGYKNSKRRPGILATAEAVVSQRLREILAAELTKLGVEHALLDSLSDRASDSPPDGDGDTPRFWLRKSQQPEPEPEPEPKRGPRKRGTRLPDGWKPSDEMRAWTLQQPGWDRNRAASELVVFSNYWQAKAGQSATKVDWDKTWMNWILRINREAGNGHKADAAGELRIVDGAIVS